MNNMNKVMLIGNLAADPELRQTASGKYTTEIRLGVNRRGRDAGCDWLSVVCWQTTAETVCKYLHKGDKIAVSGRLQSRSYEAKDGGKRYVTEVVADEVEFLPRRAADAEAASESADARNADAGFVQVQDDDLPF